MASNEELRTHVHAIRRTRNTALVWIVALHGTTFSGTCCSNSLASCISYTAHIGTHTRTDNGRQNGKQEARFELKQNSGETRGNKMRPRNESRRTQNERWGGKREGTDNRERKSVHCIFDFHVAIHNDGVIRVKW